MRHDTFLSQIDRFLDGTLDIVEWSEFTEHERSCTECALLLNKRLWQRFEEGYAVFDFPRPQPCLNESTIRRLVDLSLPSQYDEAIQAHLAVCKTCSERASTLVIEDLDAPPASKSHCSAPTH